MSKKNFSRNDTKIREQKNLFIPLCSVLVICSIAGSIAYGINIKQTKELDRLEAISKTEEDRAKEYRTEVKNILQITLVQIKQNRISCRNPI